LAWTSISVTSLVKIDLPVSISLFSSFLPSIQSTLTDSYKLQESERILWNEGREFQNLSYERKMLWQKD
jgi:hypothetical protein